MATGVRSRRMNARSRISPSVDLALVREDINRVAAAHGACNVRVFGSARHGSASRVRDIDLLVHMTDGRSLFDLVALEDELQQMLGIPVDVVTEGGLSPYLRDRIIAEAVAL